MNYKAKTLTTMICTALLTPVCAFALSDNQASAVTAADLNADEVFVKQHTSYTCTLSSNTMLLRRAAMLKGMDWQSITEESCRNSFWIVSEASVNLRQSAKSLANSSSVPLKKRHH